MHKTKKRMDEKKERMKKKTYTCKQSRAYTNRIKGQASGNHDMVTTTVSSDGKVPTQRQRRKQRRKQVTNNSEQK